MFFFTLFGGTHTFFSFSMGNTVFHRNHQPVTTVRPVSLDPAKNQTLAHGLQQGVSPVVFCGLYKETSKQLVNST